MKTKIEMLILRLRNNNKSYKNINIIYKGNSSDNTRNIKKLILNNSTQFLYSKNSLDNESF